VGNTDGARVSGILLEAGPGSRDSLLEWGHHDYRGDPRNPGVLHDIFARVGGTTNQAVVQVAARAMVRVSAGNVIGDNVWLWRADHGVGGLVRNGDNPCDHGLVVTGSHVTMYGLAVEHALQDLVQWSGDAGETYFFQSEFPYDVTQAYGDAGYASYRVNNTVETHHAYGVGVYHYFRDYPVQVDTGIRVPPWLVNSFQSPLGVFLNGQGQMMHIINGMGAATTAKTSQAMWSCEKGPHVDYVPPETTETSTTATLTTTRTSTTATTSTYTGTLTRTTTTLTSTTATTTRTRTTTTATTTVTSTSTSTTTSTTTVTPSSTSTTTTTTTTMVWWVAFAGNVPGGVLPWAALLLPLNTLLVCTIMACGWCRKRRISEEPQVPVSRLLSILGSPRRQGSFLPMSNLFDSRLFDGGTPKEGPVAGSPGRHVDTARTISVERGLASALRGRSSSLLDGHGLQGSPRRSDSPMRQNMARMFSVMSVAESVFSLSPRAAPSPWVRRHHEETEV